MNRLASILPATNVVVDVEATSKKRAFEQAHEDMYAAIDQLMDKLDRQVLRHKDRLQDHHHTASKRLDADAA